MGAAARMSRIDIDSVYTVDVTDHAEHLDIALHMVATNYAAFSSRPISTHEVYEELCHDIYQQKNLARTLLTFGRSAANHSEPIPLGTTRIVLGSLALASGELEPLEAMKLVSPADGWEHFKFCDFSPQVACEFGRYTVEPIFRGQHDLKGVICKQLVHKGIKISAEQFGANQFWAVMPRYFIRMLDTIGIKTIPAPEIQLNVAKHAALFEKYDKYWYHSSPWFYRIID